MNNQFNNTQAINLYQKESIYYSNRAVAYRTVQDYENVKRDAFQALYRNFNYIILQLDNKNVRAYFILGTVNLILGQQDKCLIQASEGVNFLIQAQKYIELKPQLKESVDYNYSKGLILKSKLEKSENYKEFIKLKDNLITKFGKDINLSKLTYPGLKENFVPTQVECYTCIVQYDFLLKVCYYVSSFIFGYYSFCFYPGQFLSWMNSLIVLFPFFYLKKTIFFCLIKPQHQI